MKTPDTIEHEQELDPLADRQPIPDTIAGHPLLKELDLHCLRLLSDCAMPISFGAGDIIFREGDPANRFYLIQEGNIALEAMGGNGERILIQTIGAGDVLGWSWLFPPHCWQFDARVIEPVKAIFFYATPLREECETDHDLGYQFMKRMASIMLRRLQATRRKLLDRD